MGISGQDKVLWQTNDLPLDGVVFLLEQFATWVNPVPEEEHPQQQRRWLKLGIDANLMCSTSRLLSLMVLSSM